MFNSHSDGHEFTRTGESTRFKKALTQHRKSDKGLGYSKDLDVHKPAVALHFGIYNFVRIHNTLGTTPALAAGVEFERWSLERAVEMTADYIRRKEDAKFEKAFAEFECAG